jgi:hypothetical protein
MTTPQGSTFAVLDIFGHVTFELKSVRILGRMFIVVLLVLFANPCSCTAAEDDLIGTSYNHNGLISS